MHSDYNNREIEISCISKWQINTEMGNLHGEFKISIVTHIVDGLFVDGIFKLIFIYIFTLKWDS